MAKVPIIRLPAKAEFYRTLGMLWLRYEQGCHVITCERSPVASSSRPDVLGLNRSNQLIEIEIKVDLRDMQHDEQKEMRKKLITDVGRTRPATANFLYYFVREDMVAAALSQLPEHCGVLSPHHGVKMHGTGLPVVAVHRKAVQIHDVKLDGAAIKNMIAQQASTMARLGVELVYEKLLNDQNNREAVVIGLSDDVPHPGSISPAEAILDAGDRTARKHSGFGLDQQWSSRKHQPTVQQRSSGPAAIKAKVVKS